MSKKDTVLVLAAAYDDVGAAEADYEAIKALYYDVKTSHDFDAAVIDRDESGKVRVVKKHEQPTRHGAAAGMGWRWVRRVCCCRGSRWWAWPAAPPPVPRSAR